MTTDGNHAWSGIRQIAKDEFVTENVEERNGRFYGGHLISQALYCAYQSLPSSDYDINSFHSYFVKKGSGKLPITLKVRRIRDGRNFVFRSVQLFQSGDDLIFHCEFTFRKPPAQPDLKITQALFPNVPAPERVADTRELREEMRRRSLGSRQDRSTIAFRRFFNNLEIRPCNGIEYLIGPQRPTLKQNIWVRYKPREEEGVDSRVHKCLVVSFMSDMGLAFTGSMPFPNTAFRVLTSLDHSGWLHDTAFDPHEFMLFEQECLMHSRGTSLVHGRLWTRSGQLVASLSQEAVIEPIHPLELKKESSKL